MPERHYSKKTPSGISHNQEKTMGRASLEPELLYRHGRQYEQGRSFALSTESEI